jgi:membrane protease YdiL (CAAX protease family)
MSSLPDCASPPLVPAPPPIPIVAEAAAVAAAPKPPRTWYFIGTALFGVGVFAIQSLAQLAVFLAMFVWSGAAPAQTPEQLRLLTHNGGWLAVAVIVACPVALGALWIPIRIARRTFSDYLALRWPDRGEVVRGLGLLAALLVVWLLLAYAFGQTIPAFMIESYTSARTSGFLPAYVLAFCVGAPVAEEFLVRGFLFRGWSQSFLGIPGAIVLSSAAWASLHSQYNWFYITDIFTLGLLLGVLRHRTGSTWLTVILHAANNLVAVVLAAMATS